MKLIIDQGNTSAKIALFNNGQNLCLLQRVESVSSTDLNKILDAYGIESAIFSSTKELDKNIIYQLNSKEFKTIFLSSQTSIPITNCYRTPHTLGNDRLAAVVGVSYLKPFTNALVIDAGTAITYDFINARGEYLGGNISPGVETRFTSLYLLTDKLPKIDKEGESALLGCDTHTAIRSGVVNGVIHEIEGTIEQIRNQYKDVSVFLTGGDSFFLANKLKSIIFAEPNLVLIGLNRILEYNVK